MIPRFAGDGFGLRTGPKNRKRQEPADLAAPAEAHRAAIAADADRASSTAAIV